MKLFSKTIAFAAFLALTSGAAWAAEKAMDCCKDGKCCCEKMMKQHDGHGEKPASPQPRDHGRHR